MTNLVLLTFLHVTLIIMVMFYLQNYDIIYIIIYLLWQCFLSRLPFVPLVRKITTQTNCNFLSHFIF